MTLEGEREAFLRKEKEKLNIFMEIERRVLEEYTKEEELPSVSLTQSQIRDSFTGNLEPSLSFVDDAVKPRKFEQSTLLDFKEFYQEFLDVSSIIMDSPLDETSSIPKPPSPSKILAPSPSLPIPTKILTPTTTTSNTHTPNTTTSNTHTTNTANIQQELLTLETQKKDFASSVSSFSAYQSHQLKLLARDKATWTAQRKCLALLPSTKERHEIKALKNHVQALEEEVERKDKERRGVCERYKRQVEALKEEVKELKEEVAVVEGRRRKEVESLKRGEGRRKSLIPTLKVNSDNGQKTTTPAPLKMQRDTFVDPFAFSRQKLRDLEALLNLPPCLRVRLPFTI